MSQHSQHFESQHSGAAKDATIPLPGGDQSPVKARLSVIHRKPDSSNTGAIVRGFILAAMFYTIAPLIPVSSGFVQRYFCSHPLEYIGTCLFFIGIGILWTKLRQISLEREAVSLLALLAVDPDNAIAPPSTSVSLWARYATWLHDRGKTLQNTVAVRRVAEAMHYAEVRPEKGLEDHLKYLADLASDRLHQSYALLRTISWAIPILGFLGTVIGITIAIANVTPEQLDSSLPEVTGGLAVAFDTTAQALGMSIILVFGAFLVERSEQTVLNDVEQFGIDHLANQLAETKKSTNATVSRDEEFAQQTRQLLLRHEQTWGEHLNSLHMGWSDILAARTAQLSESLDRETQASLDIHRQSIIDSRDAYAAVLHESTDRFTRMIEQTMNRFVDKVDLWQSALQTTSLSATGQAEELHRLGRTLLQLAEAEQKLAAMQQQLNQNLEALEVVATLEQTVSSLNAAVHVLTAKTNVRAAA